MDNNDNKEVIIISLEPINLESISRFRILMENDLVMENKLSVISEEENDNGIAVASFSLDDETCEENNTDDCSLFYEEIKEYYNKYNWTADMLIALMQKGYINENEYNKIINGE